MKQKSHKLFIPYFFAINGRITITEQFPKSDFYSQSILNMGYWPNERLQNHQKKKKNKKNTFNRKLNLAIF